MRASSDYRCGRLCNLPPGAVRHIWHQLRQNDAVREGRHPCTAKCVFALPLPRLLCGEKAGEVLGRGHVALAVLRDIACGRRFRRGNQTPPESAPNSGDSTTVSHSVCVHANTAGTRTPRGPAANFRNRCWFFFVQLWSARSSEKKRSTGRHVRGVWAPPCRGLSTHASCLQRNPWPRPFGRLVFPMMHFFDPWCK